MKITRAVVPSLFTVLNIFCGFLSLVNTARGDYATAAWFIIVAAICDVLDGAMARITKSYSEFGVEFDSLSDVVSFGVAPSFLAYTIHLHSLGSIGMLITVMPMVFGAMRLARFNVQLVGFNKDYFRGLPIPSTALTISSFILMFHRELSSHDGLEAGLLSPMIVVLSLLMVSNIKYDTIPKFTKRSIVRHPLRFTVAVASLTAIVITQGRALFPFFVFYVMTGPLRYVTQAIQHALHPGEKGIDEEDTEMTSVDV